MNAPARFNKDYYGGALMVAIGLAATYAGTSYNVGSLSRMGPGFFPCAVGVLLAVTGLLIVVSARGEPPVDRGVHGHAPPGLPDLRGCFCIVLGMIAFIVLGEYGGLLPATFAISFISALGDRQNKLVHALVLALAMAAVATVVFWYALSLQLPLFQWGG